ncbi:IS240-type transposase (ISH102) [Halorubrum sp. AJ67]|nr:IS240-type transposase (ISH102) [Halorubrum sp. AJ67]
MKGDGGVSKPSIAENTRFRDCLDEINVAFVEREATPWLLLKFSVLFQLPEIPL